MSKSASFNISFDIPTEVITAYFNGKAKVESSKNKSSSNDWLSLAIMLLPALLDTINSGPSSSSSLSGDIKICPFKMGSPKDESSEDDDESCCSDSSSDEEEEGMTCEDGVCFVNDKEDKDEPTTGSVLQTILNLDTEELKSVPVEALIQSVFNGSEGNEMVEQVSKMIPMFENIFSASKKCKQEESDEKDEDFKDDEDSEVEVE